MSNLWKLFKGEVFRLAKYKVLFFGVLVSAIWVLVIALVSKAEAESFIPFLIVMDDGLMAIVLLGSMFYYEKQEGIAKSLLVAPITVSQVLIAKVAAAIFSGLISVVLIFLAALIFHGLVINLFLAIIYMVLAVIAHTAIGYVIILASRDFMGMLVKYMGVILVLIAPTILVALNIIPTNLSFLAILSPTYASQLLIESIFQTTDLWKILVSVGWLLTIGGLLYPLVIRKQYQRYALEG